MRTKILSLLTIFTFLSCQSNAQNSEVEDVKSVLQSFINAGDINDEKKLSPHLHADFRVVLFDKKKDETAILNKATYVSFIASKKFGGYKRSASFEDIQFIGKHMATAKATLTSPGKPTLKNFYSLVKIKNEWVVIQDYVILIP